MIQLKYYRSLIRVLSLLICLFTYSGQFAQADFDDTGVGARPMGMGGAFVGLADNVYALYYNPAGLGWQKRSELATEYERLYWGLSDDSNISGGFIGYVHPLKFYSHEQEKIRKSTGTVTGARKSTDTVKTVLIEKVKNYGVIGVGWVNFGLNDVYEESILSLSWGKRYGNRLSYGLNTKFLTQKYTQDAYTRIDPVFDYGSLSSLSAYSFDIGLLYNIAPRVFTGLMVMDVNQPDLGFKETEKLPMSIKTGICYRDKALKVLTDVIKKDEDIRINCGAERWFFKNSFGVRGGTSLGSRNLRDITIGTSWNLLAFQIDYGFRFPLSGIEDTIGSHRVSLIYRFGKAPEDELEPGSIEAELNKLEKDQRELRARLKDAVEMKEKMEQVLIEEALARVREKIKAVKYYPSSKKAKRKVKSDGIRTHVVEKGETLRSIAKDYFGTSKKWLDIYNINKDKVGRGGSVKRGTVLILPGGEEKVETKTAKSAVKPSKPVKPESKGVKPVKKAITATQQKTTKKAVQTKKKKAVPVKKKKHVVSAGETIRSLAVKYYNDPARWKDIYKANKDKIKMGRIEEGTVLTIP